MKEILKSFVIAGMVLTGLVACSLLKPEFVNARETNSIKEKAKNIISDANTPEEKMEKIFYYIRDQIFFDFLENSLMSAEEVLVAGRGSCMHKAVLLAEMAKESGIPARLHFMWVPKEALRDLLHPVSYFFWANPFLHTYPEVKLNGRWVPMEATFDRELHEILLKKGLNFSRYPERRDISIEFSKSGVVGAQQLTAVKGRDPIYADNLTPLREMIESLPWFKKKMHTWALRRSSRWLNQKVRTP
ncbi:MAG: transglutaminase-like domain-containing protein [Methanosarcinaceae archaeon]|nr:transglutaminase-like domain-containing protein [Methanosarcinaceae archaeon]